MAKSVLLFSSTLDMHVSPQILGGRGWYGTRDLDCSLAMVHTIPGKLLEICNFLPGPWKTPEKKLFTLYSCNSPKILWRMSLL